MSNIKTIGIDNDDTITNTFDKAEEYLINHIEYIPYDELYEGKTERAINFAKERLETIQRECLPKEHAIEVIKRLKDKGYKIIIITARGSELKYDHEKITKDYFKKYNIPYDDMIFSSINKGLDCKNNNIDILIDDREENLDSAIDYGIIPIKFKSVREPVSKYPTFDNWLYLEKYLEGEF